jgi:hypothetical protein
MVNVGVVLLILLTIILTAAIVGALVWAGISSNQPPSGATGPPPAPPCQQTVVLDSLIQIPTMGANCIQRGVTGSKFYIGNLGTGSLDFVVAPWGTQPLNVCVDFCSSFTGGICSGPNFNGQSAQANFNHCMQQLAGVNCTPPVPIAAQGTILYYAFSPTCLICDNCGEIPPM